MVRRRALTLLVALALGACAGRSHGDAARALDARGVPYVELARAPAKPHCPGARYEWVGERRAACGEVCCGPDSCQVARGDCPETVWSRVSNTG